MTFEIEEEFGDVLHAYADARHDGEEHYSAAYDKSRAGLISAYNLFDEMPDDFGEDE